MWLRFAGAAVLIVAVVAAAWAVASFGVRPVPSAVPGAPASGSPGPTLNLAGIGGPADDNGFHPTVQPCDPYGNYYTGVAPEWNIWILGGDPWTYDIRPEYTGEVGTGIVPLAPQNWWENASDEQKRQYYASSVTWATRPGSAAAAEDFVAASGTFAVADHPGGAFVSVVDDQRADPTESFFIDLVSTTGILPIGPCSTIEVGIWDNDFLVIDPVPPVTEGSNNAVTEVPVTLHLVYPQPVPVIVALGPDYPGVVDDTAEEGIDWTVAPGGEHTLQPGQLTTGFIVDVIGDDDDEPDEMFTLLAATGDEVQRGWDSIEAIARTVVTIIDDDPGGPTATPTSTAPRQTPSPGAPTPGNFPTPSTEVSIGDASVAEGSNGPLIDLNFPVTLSQPYPFDLEVDVEILPGTATLYLAAGGPVRGDPPRVDHGTLDCVGDARPSRRTR